MGSRKCPECGRLHNLCVQNMETDEVIEEVDKCRDCLMAGCGFNPITAQIHIQANDVEEQHMADQLSKAYNNFIKDFKVEDLPY